jgi:hypothetical protein
MDMRRGIIPSAQCQKRDWNCLCSNAHCSIVESRRLLRLPSLRPSPLHSKGDSPASRRADLVPSARASSAPGSITRGGAQGFNCAVKACPQSFQLLKNPFNVHSSVSLYVSARRSVAGRRTQAHVDAVAPRALRFPAVAQSSFRKAAGFRLLLTIPNVEKVHLSK